MEAFAGEVEMAAREEAWIFVDLGGSLGGKLKRCEGGSVPSSFTPRNSKVTNKKMGDTINYLG
jgi:hypothetical protein